MKHLLIFAAVAANLVAAAARWPQEPNGFRGVQFGVPEATVRAGFPMLPDCQISQKDKDCVFFFDMATVQSSCVAGFLEDAFSGVDCLFPVEGWESVRAVLTERFGPSHNAGSSTISWTGPTATATLRRDSSPAIVKKIASAQYKWDLDRVTKKDSLAIGDSLQRLYRTGDRRQYERDRSEREAESKSEEAEAEKRLDAFKSRKYSSYTIVLNSYARHRSTLDAEAIKKSADKL